VRWIDGDRGEKRIDVALKVGLYVGALIGIEFVPLEQPDTLFPQFGKKKVVPAAVLGLHEAVDFSRESGERFIWSEAVVTGFTITVLDALHEAGLTNFDVFIEIGSGDGEKLDPFEQRIGRVFSFFEDAAIELHPGVVASGKELLFLLCSSHGSVQTVLESLQRFASEEESEAEIVTARHAYR
jgi:hypothetical protein